MNILLRNLDNIETEKKNWYTHRLTDVGMYGNVWRIKTDFRRMRKSHRNNLFYNACYMGYIEVVKLLLEKMDSFGSYDYMSALYEACRGGYMEIIDLLIENYNYRSSEFYNALHGACAGGKIEIVKFLMGETNFTISHNLSDIFYIACFGGSLEVVKYIYESQNIINIEEGLLMACSDGYLDIIEFLIEKGANDFARALDSAWYHSQPEVISFLLQHCQNINYTLDFNSYFRNICRYKNLEIIKIFVEHCEAIHYPLNFNVAIEGMHHNKEARDYIQNIIDTRL
jgi:ankyrin repeat protein